MQKLLSDNFTFGSRKLTDISYEISPDTFHPAITKRCYGDVIPEMTRAGKLITYMDMKKREVREDISLTDENFSGRQIGGDTGVSR